MDTALDLMVAQLAIVYLIVLTFAHIDMTSQHLLILLLLELLLQILHVDANALK
jgi:hypothetical protein